jgi:Tfp pilus assembly protein PilE
MLKQSKNSQAGFTLIELLTFIIALAILVIIIISFQTA